MKKSLILASSSPRRIEILRKNCIEPRIIKPEVEETLPDGIAMEDAVMYLALKKALFVEDRIRRENEELGGADYKNTASGSVIIAADTVVYKGRIIGKPRGEAEALEIFELLRAAEHEVATGVAILESGSTNRRVFYEVTKVCFKDYDEREIRSYIATDEPWDKAGGYAIQGVFAKHIDHIVGDYENVIGFPWKRIQNELNDMGLEL